MDFKEFCAEFWKCWNKCLSQAVLNVIISTENNCNQNIDELATKTYANPIEQIRFFFNCNSQVIINKKDGCNNLLSLSSNRTAGITDLLKTVYENYQNVDCIEQGIKHLKAGFHDSITYQLYKNANAKINNPEHRITLSKEEKKILIKKIKEFKAEELDEKIYNERVCNEFCGLLKNRCMNILNKYGINLSNLIEDYYVEYIFIVLLDLISDYETIKFKKYKQSLENEQSKIKTTLDIFIKKRFANTSTIIKGRLPVLRSIPIRRTNIFELLYNKLKTNGYVYLYGTGGIGKTFTAIDFAHWLMDKHEYKVYFTFYNNNFWDTLLSLDEKRNNTNRSVSYKRVMNALSSTETLLIIDNVDIEDVKGIEENLETDYFQKLVDIGVKILITTRNIPESTNLRVHLKPLNNNELINIMIDHCPSLINEPNKLLCDVIECVSSNTLILCLISKIITESMGRVSLRNIYNTLTDCKLEKFNNKIKSDRIGDDFGCNHLYGHILSLFSVAEMSDEKKRILSVLLMCSKSGINTLQFIETSKSNDMDIKSLISQGWLSYDEVTNTISLHSLIRIAVIKHLEEYFYNKISCGQKNECILSIGYNLTDVFERHGEVKRALNISNLIINVIGNSRFIVKNPIYVRFLIGCNYTRVLYADSNNYKDIIIDALDLYKKLNVICNELNYGEEKCFLLGLLFSNVAALYLKLGIIKKDKSYYINAYKYHLKALKTRKEYLNKYSENNFYQAQSRYAKSLSNLGTVCYYIGNYTKCIKYQNKAADVYKTLNNKDNYYYVVKNIIGAYLKKWKNNDIEIDETEFELCSAYIDEMLEYYKWDKVFYLTVLDQKNQLKNIKNQKKQKIVSRKQ